MSQYDNYGTMPTPQDSYKNVHPLLIVGVFIFIVPFLKDTIKIGLPDFMFTIMSVIGMLCIILGGFLSIGMRN